KRLRKRAGAPRRRRRPEAPRMPAGRPAGPGRIARPCPGGPDGRDPRPGGGPRPGRRSDVDDPAPADDPGARPREPRLAAAAAGRCLARRVLPDLWELAPAGGAAGPRAEPFPPLRAMRRGVGVSSSELPLLRPGRPGLPGTPGLGGGRPEVPGRDL